MMGIGHWFLGLRQGKQQKSGGVRMDDTEKYLGVGGGWEGLEILTVKGKLQRKLKIIERAC